MPRRGPTRGDVLVAVATVGVLVCSFLPFYEVTAAKAGDKNGTDTYSAWTPDFYPLAAAVVVVPLVAFVLLLTGRFLNTPAQTPAGGPPPWPVALGQWAVALGLVAAFCGVWAAVGTNGGYDDLAAFVQEQVRGQGTHKDAEVTAGQGYGAWLLAGCVVAQGVFLLLGDRVRALGVPLVGEPAAAQASWPGSGGSYAPPPHTPYATTPQPVSGAYATPPVVPSSPPYPVPAVPGSPPSVLNSGSYTPDAEDFEQTWLAVPLPRDLFPQSGPDHTPVARLEPGTWYLAVAPFHEGLLVEVNGVRGVLYDLDGIQRGE